MSVIYDNYYQDENYFGAAIPELIALFDSLERGSVLDVGCGQGRDALALGRLGYAVLGLDQSKVGIEQMNKVSELESLDVRGRLQDIYTFEDFDQYDYILLDSMLHFEKKELVKEVGLLHKIANTMKPGASLVICIQDMSRKTRTLHETLEKSGLTDFRVDEAYNFTFFDKKTGHTSTSPYRLILVQKDVRS